MPQMDGNPLFLGQKVPKKVTIVEEEKPKEKPRKVTPKKRIILKEEPVMPVMEEAYSVNYTTNQNHPSAGQLLPLI